VFSWLWGPGHHWEVRHKLILYFCWMEERNAGNIH
jgi:hypothetical protein